MVSHLSNIVLDLTDDDDGIFNFVTLSVVFSFFACRLVEKVLYNCEVHLQVLKSLHQSACILLVHNAHCIFPCRKILIFILTF